MKKRRRHFKVVGLDQALGRDYSVRVIGRMRAREFLVEEVQHVHRAPTETTRVR